MANMILRKVTIRGISGLLVESYKQGWIIYQSSNAESYVFIARKKGILPFVGTLKQCRKEMRGVK